MFHYEHGRLFCEQVDLEEIARGAGTPCYVYSTQSIMDSWRAYDDALGELPHLVCYAVKANSNLAVLKLFAGLGAGADVVSEGELRRALAAGAAPETIVFSGVGKTAREIAFALDTGILCFNVESEPELETISEIASGKGLTAAIAIRINPDIDAKTHAVERIRMAYPPVGVTASGDDVYVTVAGDDWIRRS